MPTKVVLTADVPGLGKKDTVASVKDGYAHNYLFRNKLARPYSEAARAELAQKAESAAQQRALDEKLALAAKAKIDACELRFALTLNEHDKAFGSITSAQVMEALAAQHVQIDRAALPDLRLGVGEHKVPVKLLDTVHAELKIVVAGEK